MDTLLKLWEILIPAQWRESEIPWSQSSLEIDEFPIKIPTDHHHAWDALVDEISRGITFLPRVRGKWKDEDEASIPVRIACSKEEIEKIARLTLKHYNQENVLYYCISDYVILTGDR